MKWLIPLLIVLPGCTTTKYIEVKVPVPVPCRVPNIEEPVYPKASPDAGIFERVKVALAEIELRKGYEAKLKAAVAACGDSK